MHRLERHLVERSAHVFTCSERDQGRLHLLYGVPKDRMSLAPNGIKAARDRAPGPVRSVMQRWPQLRRFPRLALFSGSNVAHNRAAVHFILERLAPALRDECAFVVQGGCGVSFGRETAANVCFDVSADGFALYADGSTVGLNPIEQGSGSNLKLLQYLYHGMPVISTPFGMRGYETLRRFVTVAPLEGFADALRTAAHAPRPEPEALVREFGWRTIGQSIVNVYATLRAEKRISGDSHGDGQASAARR
jgi:hypothetical protein